MFAKKYDIAIDSRLTSLAETRALAIDNAPENYQSFLLLSSVHESCWGAL